MHTCTAASTLLTILFVMRFGNGSCDEVSPTPRPKCFMGLLFQPSPCSLRVPLPGKHSTIRKSLNERFSPVWSGTSLTRHLYIWSLMSPGKAEPSQGVPCESRRKHCFEQSEYQLISSYNKVDGRPLPIRTEISTLIPREMRSAQFFPSVELAIYQRAP